MRNPSSFAKPALASMALSLAATVPTEAQVEAAPRDRARQFDAGEKDYLAMMAGARTAFGQTR